MKVSFSHKQKGGLHLIKYLKFNEYQMADCRHCLWMKEFPKSWCWLVSQHQMGVLYACHNPLLQTLHVAGTWFTFSFSQLVFNWREWANIRYGGAQVMALIPACMNCLRDRWKWMYVSSISWQYMNRWIECQKFWLYGFFWCNQQLNYQFRLFHHYVRWSCHKILL